MSDLVGNPEDRFSCVAAHYYSNDCYSIHSYDLSLPCNTIVVDEKDNIQTVNPFMKNELAHHYHLSRLVGKPTMWFPNRSDTDRSVQ